MVGVGFYFPNIKKVVGRIGNNRWELNRGDYIDSVKGRKEGRRESFFR